MGEVAETGGGGILTGGETVGGGIVTAGETVGGGSLREVRLWVRQEKQQH